MPLVERFQQQRRRTGDKQTHVRGLCFGKAWLGQHAHIERGNAHEHCCFWHFGDDKFGVKLGHPNHLAAIEQGTVDGHKQTMHMEDGQGMNEHITGLPAPIVFQGLCVAQHVAVREHRAFAAACGAAGVQNGSQVIGLVLHHLVFVRAMSRTL